MFFENFTSPKIPLDTRPEFVSVAGGENLNSNNVLSPLKAEANMDFQLGYSIVWPQQLRQYQIGGAGRVDAYGDLVFNRLLDGLDGSYW